MTWHPNDDVKYLCHTSPLQYRWQSGEQTIRLDGSSGLLSVKCSHWMPSVCLWCYVDDEPDTLYRLRTLISHHWPVFPPSSPNSPQHPLLTGGCPPGLKELGTQLTEVGTFSKCHKCPPCYVFFAQVYLCLCNILVNVLYLPYGMDCTNHQLVAMLLTSSWIVVSHRCKKNMPFWP